MNVQSCEHHGANDVIKSLIRDFCSIMTHIKKEKKRKHKKFGPISRVTQNKESLFCIMCARLSTCYSVFLIQTDAKQHLYLIFLFLKAIQCSVFSSLHSTLFMSLTVASALVLDMGAFINCHVSKPAIVGNLI